MSGLWSDIHQTAGGSTAGQAQPRPIQHFEELKDIPGMLPAEDSTQ